MWRRTLASAVCVAVLATACTKEPEDSAPDRASSSEVEQRYGEAPKRVPGVDYQPDVVFLEDGPRAIRAASSDGLRWTLDGNSPGVRDLQPGKVLLASRLALGRVVATKPVGDDVEVVIAPVQLTEVIRDGHIKIDEPVDLSSMTAQHVPDAPGVLTTPAPSFSQTTPPPGGGAPRAAVMQAARRDGGLPLPGLLKDMLENNKAKFRVGNVEFEPFMQKGVFGLKMQYNGPSEDGVGLRGGVNIKFAMNKPHAVVDMPIDDGKAGPSTFQLTGLQSVGVDLEVGSAGGTKDNQRARIEVPVDLVMKNLPPLYGIPMALTVKFKVIFEVGFTSKNSTLRSKLSYSLSGPIGSRSGTLLQPTLNPIEDPTELTHGLSLGPLGFHIAFETKFIVGAGVPQFIGGIYGKLILSLGLYSSGSMGMVHCDGGKFVGSLSAGIGANVSNQARDFLKKYFNRVVPKDAPRREIEPEVQALGPYQIIDLPFANPNTKYCRAETS